MDTLNWLLTAVDIFYLELTVESCCQVKEAFFLSSGKKFLYKFLCGEFAVKQDSTSELFENRFKIQKAR